MTANTRTAARQLRRLLQGVSSALGERASASFPRPFGSLARPSFSLPRGSRETWANGVMTQLVRGVKISGSEGKAVMFNAGEDWIRHRAESVHGAGPGDILILLVAKAGRIEKVLKAQHTTQGRGGATIQVEVRDVQSGLKSSARLRTSEGIEKVFVDERLYTFLYEEDNMVYLMEPATFEQVEIPKTYFETGSIYLTDGMDVMVHYFDGKALSASVPARVTCTVAQAEPYFKGQTATPTYKKVILENGQQILTPTFISAGDVIVVDTTDDSYVTRSKT